MDVLNLPGVPTGWPSWIIAIVFLAAWSWYIIRSAKSKAKVAAEEAQKSAEAAQKSAIEAMQSEIDALRRRIEDEREENAREIDALTKRMEAERKENAREIQSVRSENTRLKYTIDTICAALKTQGIIITISGEMVNIVVEDPKKSTTIRIQDNVTQTDTL